MVDSTARSEAAKLLSEWLNGNVTNFQMEDRWPTKSKDEALAAISERVWTLYDDFPEKCLDASELSNDELELVERCQRFLNSELEYQWPKFSYATGNVPVYRRLLPGGSKSVQSRIEEFESANGFSHWPFDAEQAENNRSG